MTAPTTPGELAAAISATLLEAVRTEARLWATNGDWRGENRFDDALDRLARNIGANEIWAEAARDCLLRCSVRLAKLAGLAYLPCTWHCTRCAYTETSTTVSAIDGGASAGPTPPLVCPNDGEEMERETWRERATTLSQMLHAVEQERDARPTLEDALDSIARAGVQLINGYWVGPTWTEALRDVYRRKAEEAASRPLGQQQST